MMGEYLFILLGVCLILLLMFLETEWKLRPGMNNRGQKKKKKKKLLKTVCLINHNGINLTKKWNKCARMLAVMDYQSYI